jgi:hypothetical protein
MPRTNKPANKIMSITMTAEHVKLLKKHIRSTNGDETTLSDDNTMTWGEWTKLRAWLRGVVKAYSAAPVGAVAS